jgi:hypothetical protein
LRRRALIGLAMTAIAVEGTWYAIHNVPGFGPAVADGVRAVLGPAAVAWAEDTAYGIADRVNQWRYKDAAPTTFWETPAAQAATLPPPEAAPPPASPIASAAPAAPAAPASPKAPAFPPPAFSPPHANVAAQGDGVWIPMSSGAAAAAEGGAPAVLYKTAVHPDPKRTFAAVAVVALDLRHLDLHLVSGTMEPFSITVPKERRQGTVAKDDLGNLVAAFNGGFKATHGNYGMMIAGDTYLPPRDISCTVALFRDGSIGVRTWPALKDKEGAMAAYRQTPPCLVEEGALNPNLTEYNKSWGSTVSGETIIRRSAVGVDRSGRTLFYGLGEAVTAVALGNAMKAAGAHSVAQLDVNHAYPRFVLFDRRSPDAAPEAASTLIPGIDFDRLDYTAQPSPRDFFYITRKRSAS